MSSQTQSTPTSELDRQLRTQLVDKLRDSKRITSAVVEHAFRQVPRHLFVPETPLEQVYRDQVIPVKFDGREAISSSSQPAMMAIMLEQLDLQPGDKVLEIGAGTGFNAALMGHIVGEQGHVTTIDIEEDLVVAAREHLKAAGVENVTVICGDGTLGYAPNGRYDRIILTVGGWDIAPAWWEQLAPNGRLLLPLSFNGPQLSIVFERVGERLESRSVHSCGFMRLRGDHAEPSQTMSLGEHAELVSSSKEFSFAETAVPRWLNESNTRRSTGLSVSNRQIWGSFALWLGLYATNTCSLYAWKTAAGNDQYPALFRLGGKNPRQRSYGLFDDGGVAVLEKSAGAGDEPNQTFVLNVRTIGKEAIGQQLVDSLRAWDAAGRPQAENLHITAYPAQQNDIAQLTPSGNITLRKRWSTFVCQWQSK